MSAPRHVLVAMGLVAAAALGAGDLGATAATRPAITITPRTVDPGGSIKVLGRGWPSGRGVRLYIGPPNSEADPFALVRADRRGRFTKRVRIALDDAPGTWVILACRRECRVKASARFTIGAPAG